MQSNFSDAYWTLAQLVAHHTINGCALRPGDLFGSGTLSGPTPDQGGSLLELSLGGKQKVIRSPLIATFDTDSFPACYEMAIKELTKDIKEFGALRVLQVVVADLPQWASGFIRLDATIQVA